MESRGEAEAFFALLHCTHTGRLLLQPPQERGGAAPPGLEMWWDDDERGRQRCAQHPQSERNLRAAVLIAWLPLFPGHRGATLCALVR